MNLGKLTSLNFFPLQFHIIIIFSLFWMFFVYFIQLPCDRDKSCGKGNYCDLHYGGCRRHKTAGEPCRRDGHCSRGMHCRFGSCQTAVAEGMLGKIHCMVSFCQVFKFVSQDMKDIHNIPDKLIQAMFKCQGKCQGIRSLNNCQNKLYQIMDWVTFPALRIQHEAITRPFVLSRRNEHF